MSNQSTSPWRSAELRDFAEREIKKGRTYTEIASDLSLTRDQVEGYLKRKGLTFAKFAPSVAGVPRNLLEPRNGFARDVRAPKIEHPKGWEPHVEEAGDKAVAVSQPMEERHPDEKKLIEGWKLDPAEWQIVGPLNCRRWQSMVPVEENSTDCRCESKQTDRHYEERWLYYYKANLQRRTAVAERIDISELTEAIRKHRPVRLAPPTGDTAFVVCLADTQLGKPDGDGVRGTVLRFLQGIEEAAQRAKDLRRIGVPVGPLYVFGMGDIIEGCDNFYPQQTFRVELDRREQVKVMRKLIAQALERWSPLFEKVVVAAVAGNHGENRKDGKSFTTFADNDDVSIFEMIEESFTYNPAAYGHVSFMIPKDRLDMTLDVCGRIVGLTHGHQAGRGATPTVKLTNWWKDQAHGKQAIGDADILISAHYHHFIVSQMGAKTHFQCPALEGGSDWYRNFSGQESPPGMLTMTINAAGWDNVKILAQQRWITADDERRAVLDTRLHQRAGELAENEKVIAVAA